MSITNKTIKFLKKKKETAIRQNFFKVVRGKFLVANHFYLFQFCVHLKKGETDKVLKCALVPTTRPIHLK